MVTVGVLISGAGTNLQAILDRAADGSLDCRVAVVLSNRAEAPGLQRAARAAIPTRVIDHRGFASREAFDAALVDTLRAAGVELVVLAGFDRLVTRVLLDAFPNRILNIHPALLPAFKGLHAQRQALAYGVRIAGATVHFVDEAEDHGPIVLQGAILVAPDDTEETLAQRILDVEHIIYPAAIQLFAEGRLVVEGRRVRIRGERPARGRLLPVVAAWDDEGSS
ncbi:MAG TPA: phosphoribosylglycinamide formyltransferase [Candidatus Binatia bacterium]|nr:phosphoribosylglycinamide formyltransferase [Candidatus Binatia bacterium]